MAGCRISYNRERDRETDRERERERERQRERERERVREIATSSVCYDWGFLKQAFQVLI